MDRKKEALRCINIKNGQGLELGPLYSPIVDKSEGKVFYIDHMSAEDLRKKYKGHPFDVESIVDVDYVADGTSIDKLVKGQKFDYVIACHVIEHIPDVVSWLNEISRVLKNNGILSLVIPDKRYSFDIARETTKPSDIVGAYIDNLQKSTAGMIYESISEYREITPMQAWQGNYSSVMDYPEPHNLEEGFKKAVESRKEGVYVDAHCHVFTPSSFFKIFRRLIEHELVDFEVAYFKDTNLNELEFYVSLRKIKSKNIKKQLASIPKIKPSLSTRELEKKVNKLEQKLILAEQELSSVKESKSWKITKPLRSVNSKISTNK